jgi:DnaJ-domain-containing protein 1
MTNTFEPSIAYPLHSSPHGGIHTHLPQFYKDFADELKRMESIREEEKRRQQEEKWDRFFRNFDPFGNFGERQMPCSFEEIDSEDEEDYPFSVFDLKRTASEEDMRKAYRKGILEHHPDRTGEDTSDSFRIIQEAYEHYTKYHL